ncbi:sugar phosphate isomerase/epimerase [Vibrio sp.]|uniref:Sugar phosphate isomerase/epimerase n=1 Tax=Vibrio viridaestus TaxID=2487322 RepID=A0A3N9TKL6_9VIBR|nr:sugar phosphate isomerase/epimerase family protein [Vibrio viridaestus]MDC0610272.1 sugar phosphate isomerase/epimerase [Vibrio sp.]RQW64393.1 sugar phosphate isomerase/epimerase [Vibrio viridaestus]
MLKTLHGVSTWYCNAITEVRLAHETGYDAVEFIFNKLLRYLDHGGTAKQLKAELDKYGLKAGCINAQKGIDRYYDKALRGIMLKEAERLTQAAADLECPTVQIMGSNMIDHLSPDEIMTVMTESIGEISKIGEKYGIRYQIEVMAPTQFNTLNQALQVIDSVGSSNIGVVVDFWHLHASGQTTPSDIAKLDKSTIFGVHFCDGRRPYVGEEWDETVQRAFFPGEGEVDIQAYTDAVKSTGFDGVWSPELLSPKYWEQDHFKVAKECFDNMSKYID